MKHVLSFFDDFVFHFYYIFVIFTRVISAEQAQFKKLAQSQNIWNTRYPRLARVLYRVPALFALLRQLKL